MSNARAAKRRAKHGILPPPSGIGPAPILVSEAPKTQAERYELERRCLKDAKFRGFTGKRAKIEATRAYNAAIAEAGRAVREPATQPSVLARPESTLPTPSVPRGMQQTDSGLYVPAVSQ